MELENDLCSVFLNEKLDKKTKNWIKDYSFYYGDLSKYDFSTDWRFKKVENKRKQLVFLGLVNTSFPVKLPLKLNNGITLRKL